MVTSVIVVDFCASLLYGQTYTYYRTYGHPSSNSDDIGRQIVELSDSSLIFCGEASSSFGGSADAWISKIDKNGNLLWSKTIGTSSNFDHFNALAYYGDTCIVSCGYVWNSGAGGDVSFVCRWNANGNLLWQKECFNSSGSGFNARNIVTTLDGHFFVCGAVNSGSQDDPIFFKIHRNGSLLSTVRTDQSSAVSNSYNKVIQLPDSSYVIGGYSAVTNNAGYIALVNKTVSSLTVRLLQSGIGSGAIQSVLQSSDGNLWFLGYLNKSPNADIHLIKTTPNAATILSAYTIKTSVNYPEYGMDFAELSNGDLIIVARAAVTSSNSDILLFRFSPSTGNIIWAKQIGVAGNSEYPHQLLVAKNQHFLISGFVQDDPFTGKRDALIVRADNSGNVASCNTQNVSLMVTQESVSSYTIVNPGSSHTGLGSTGNTTTHSVNSVTPVVSSSYQVVYASTTVSSCGSYVSPSGNYTWTSSGTYNDTIPAANTCDSIITIHLTVTNINTNVNQNGNVLTAQQPGASYQWVNCNNNYAVIPGATAQSFTATANGNYAVIITLNNCSDTSQCVNVTGVAINEWKSIISEISVYPNPNNGSFTIFSPYRKNLYLTDVMGRKIKNIDFSNSDRVLINDLENGMYFLKSEEYGLCIKVVVQQ